MQDHTGRPSQEADLFRETGKRLYCGFLRESGDTGLGLASFNNFSGLCGIRVVSSFLVPGVDSDWGRRMVAQTVCPTEKVVAVWALNLLVCTCKAHPPQNEPSMGRG